MKESIEVNILGKTYAFKSEFDQTFMNETAKLVNSRMEDIAGKTGIVTSEKIAVLAAMNLAGELLNVKQQNESLKSSVKSTSQNVLKIVNSLL